MSKISDAADQVISMAEKFRAITDVADVLKKLGSIEQTIVERTAAMNTAMDSHIDALARLNDVNNQIASAKDAFTVMTADHQTAMANMLQTATDLAARKVSEAEAQAKNLIDAAKVQAEQTQAATNSFLAQRNADLDGLTSAISDAKNNLDAIRNEHATTTAAVEALKSAAKAVLG